MLGGLWLRTHRDVALIVCRRSAERFDAHSPMNLGFDGGPVMVELARGSTLSHAICVNRDWQLITDRSRRPSATLEPERVIVAL